MTIASKEWSNAWAVGQTVMVCQGSGDRARVISECTVVRLTAAHIIVDGRQRRWSRKTRLPVGSPESVYYIRPGVRA